MPRPRKKAGNHARASFEAKLGSERNAILIVVPVDVRAIFGRARPPVRVTVNGYTFRSTLAVYGGVTYVGMRRSHREAARVNVGDDVRVSLELDTAPRVVKTPPALAAALKKNTKAAAAWRTLSFTHKKEHAQAIADAKKPATRERRVRAAIQMLLKK